MLCGWEMTGLRSLVKTFREASEQANASEEVQIKGHYVERLCILSFQGFKQFP